MHRQLALQAQQQQAGFLPRQQLRDRSCRGSLRWRGQLWRYRRWHVLNQNVDPPPTAALHWASVTLTS